MSHTPFGYKIVNGKAEIDEEQALQLNVIYQAYIGGASLTKAAATVGIVSTHASIGRMLRNKKYLGTDYYPAIIDKKLFDAAEEERQKRATALGRIYEYPEPEDESMPVYSFRLDKVDKKYDNPFMQAEYAYSMIESEAANE